MKHIEKCTLLIAITMHCGFCENLGLSQITCSSHNVSECRRLANTRCGYCKSFGHTTKYCEKLKLKEQKEKQAKIDKMENHLRNYAASIIITGIKLRLLESPPTPEIEERPEPVCCHELQPIAEKTLGPRQNNNPSAECLQEGKQAWLAGVKSGLIETALELDDIILNPIAV